MLKMNPQLSIKNAASYNTDNNTYIQVKRLHFKSLNNYVNFNEE